jgi:hypothetical protein
MCAGLDVSVTEWSVVPVTHGKSDRAPVRDSRLAERALCPTQVVLVHDRRGVSVGELVLVA